MIPQFTIDEVILRALKEDIGCCDISSAALFSPEQRGEAILLAKGSGVFCGGGVFARVFTLLEQSALVTLRKDDGERFESGEILAKIEAPVTVLLQGERTALNILQHLSGIAGMTADIVQRVEGTGARISDTRKNLPGLRALQKYAVTCGGGRNHRFNLSDGVMLKNNHIDACGSISKAVEILRARIGHMVKLEVEARDLEELRQALEAGADIIMLDNMSVEETRRAVELTRADARNAGVLLEASGDVTAENVREVALTGVDIISLGALTHSVKAANISFRIVRPPTQQ